MKKTSSLPSSPKVALVYDRVNTPFGGAENVLLAVHEVFPTAPLYTSVYDSQKAQWAKSFRVIPSFLQKIPFAARFHRLLVGLMPFAFESLDLSAFDIVISITSAEAKGVLTSPHQLHICYLLTPTRYLWSHQEEYESDWLTGWLRKDIFAYLRWWDKAASLRPDVLIPISELVAQRCRQFYQREPEKVIYPPVQPHRVTTYALPASTPSDFYLIVARLVPYKRIDLAIQACQKMGRNLVVIGNGPDLDRLQSLAELPNTTAEVQFLQAVQHDQVGAYYSHCRAFLAPAEEDFGITVLEAQLAGKPVVVFAKSGGAETVKEGETGIHFTEPSVAGLVEAMHFLESRQWDAPLITQNAQKYVQAHFQKQFLDTIKELWQAFNTQ
jgi:glycosyltransferase involved in cell wall biosynthesis